MASKKRKAPCDECDAPAEAHAEPTTPTAPKPNHNVPHHVPKPHFGCATEASIAKADRYFRDLYRCEPDFKKLAAQDPDFAVWVKKGGKLNFSDAAAFMQLTKTLLKADFGLKIELPDDRLCPPVTNRHNYILWLKELMDTTSYEQPGGKLCGLDVGTGASCIYPLLGAVQRPWNFVATDIDAKSLVYARKNVELNGLDKQIRVMERKASDSLVPLDDISVQSIDFVMMNPPFYESEDELKQSAENKSQPPNSACTGAPVEMICEGGEVGHVGRMLKESLILRDKVRWYTTMVGKASSLNALVGQLRENNIDNFAVTEFTQGKTRRWALGWSFAPMRPADHVARGINAGSWENLVPPLTKQDVLKLPVGNEVGPFIELILVLMGSLELISWTWDMEASRGVGRARQNVWSRSWRRKKLREMPRETPDASAAVAPKSQATDSEECRLGFAIAVQVGTDKTIFSVNWLEGHDQPLFVALADFLRGRLGRLVQERHAQENRDGIEG
ncbi:hypothetical protein B0T24DRAFT_642747 [Lasiosphaeria ovina]|uniref:U6 small nuclear RNA (adenine-(43)-N(6))-methyltransferase n=1 Tax=Lasiosphaeria ovina TaxID=92902 RepID=A0AAE0JTE2_9PEZI|nr:hypothetical protein B0T24DRAFT_642747 [Lasiosphaeria ovina]